MNYRYTINGVGYNSVSQIVYMVPNPGMEKFKQEVAMANHILNRRATIGTLVHYYISSKLADEYRLEKPKLELNEDNRYILKHEGDDIKMRAEIAEARFDKFWEDYGKIIHPISVEKRVHSESMGYAGTLDMVAEVNDYKGLTIFDWKTSAEVRPTYYAQLIGYKMAYAEMTGKYVGDCFIIRIREGASKKDIYRAQFEKKKLYEDDNLQTGVDLWFEGYARFVAQKPMELANRVGLHSTKGVQFVKEAGQDVITSGGIRDQDEFASWAETIDDTLNTVQIHAVHEALYRVLDLLPGD